MGLMKMLGRGLSWGVPLVSIVLCVACVVDSAPETKRRAPVHDPGVDSKRGDAGMPSSLDADTVSDVLLDAAGAQFMSPPLDETSPEGEESSTECDLLPSDLCSNVEEESFVVSARNALPGVSRVVSISDSTAERCEIPTVHCLEQTYPGLRFFGRAAVAMSDFACWGAGIMLDLVPEADAGARSRSFDAASLGIVGFRVRFEGLQAGSPIRVSLTQTDLPEGVALVHGKGNKDVREDGLLMFQFSDFAIPQWSTHLELAAAPLNTSKLGSLMIEVPTSEEAKPFYFALSDFEWFNDAGEPVSVTSPE
jgi:hypothetical protein